LRQLLLQGHQHPIQDRTELLIFAADRAQHVEEVINPTLLAGGIILCDRFTDSTIAYQGYGRGLSLELIENICQVATDGRTSDLTLWLDVDVEVGLARALARGTADRMEQADLAFHRRVQQGFTALAAAYPHRIVRVDASRSEAEVQQQIQMILTQKFAQWYPDNSFYPD
jgi:dTMP kinase